MTSDDGRRQVRLRPSGPRWRRLVANVRARREACCRCHQPIEYTLTHPDADAFTVDHYPHPWSTHPHLAEDPANLAAAHLRCNIGAGNAPPKPGIGQPSEAW